MLGAQSWYTALALPTAFFGGFVATRKRLAYQWREELMDMSGPAYPAITDADMEFFRRVAPASAVEAAESVKTPFAQQRATATATPAPYPDAAAEAFGVAMSAKENIGVNVRSNALTPELCNVFLNEVQRWAAAFGNSIDSRKVEAAENAVELAKARSAAGDGDHSASSASSSSSSKAASPPDLWPDFSFLRQTRMIADHAEDIQLMRAPWGCGDRIRLEAMPASLRYLVEHTRHSFQGMGRLRHVYIEYSPTGQFYRPPRPPKMYDGHDYVVIPLRRDGADAVITMSPVLRSRFSDTREVVRHSWTSRDVDALVPHGSMLRVYGTARYDWGWGVRPGPSWFGSRLNLLHSRSHAASRAAALESDRNGGASVWAKMRKTVGRWVGLGAASSPSAASMNASKDAALVVLHFEGPRSARKQRSLLLQPEIWIFGRPPSVESFETWQEDRPTADGVGEEGVVRFILRNYLDMLTVS